uniref:Uncharacterized protein n=1 Tax=Cajanus cajan TaxID=3821 RepID=A0A151UFC7_CAJCA
MADSLMQLMRLLGEDHVDEPQPQPQPHTRRRNRNITRARAPPQSLSNSGTQNMKGLINNTGYVEGNGNGSIIFGSFDATTRTFN